VLIVSVNALVAVLLALSLTCTVNANGLPVAVLGVPLITPVEALRVNPGGRAPLDMIQLL
jgi:hypothetical protein